MDNININMGDIKLKGLNILFPNAAIKKMRAYTKLLDIIIETAHNEAFKLRNGDFFYSLSVTIPTSRFEKTNNLVEKLRRDASVIWHINLICERPEVRMRYANAKILPNCEIFIPNIPNVNFVVIKISDEFKEILKAMRNTSNYETMADLVCGMSI